MLSAAVELPDSVIETLLEKRHKPNRTRLLVNFTFRRRESPLVLVNTKLFRSFSEVQFFVFESRNSKISVSISLIHSPFIAGIFFFFSSSSRQPFDTSHFLARGVRRWGCHGFQVSIFDTRRSYWFVSSQGRSVKSSAFFAGCWIFRLRNLRFEFDGFLFEKFWKFCLYLIDGQFSDAPTWTM